MQLSPKHPLFLLATLLAFALGTGCASRLYEREDQLSNGKELAKRPSVPSPSRDRIDKFNKFYVCCKVKDDYARSGFSPDFRKTYLIQEGRELVNTMFSPLHDSSQNLIMIRVSGNATTFPLSVPYMEKTAYMKKIVLTMQQYYRIPEDSVVAIISSYNGKVPIPCPVVDLKACRYIAHGLLKQALREEEGIM
ncbi:MAG: hypothetical protein JW768_00635 [Chitinispirillaceae bacterium]|nr:hypothetical protein [Chitinispirillaceae bacterium]